MPTFVPRGIMMRRKILLLTTADQGGGAAEATLRLFYALEARSEVEVRLLVLHQSIAHSSISSLQTSRFRQLKAKFYFLAERLEIFLHNGLDRAKLFRLSTAHWGFDVDRHPWVEWAEVIHLHWINQGMISMQSLCRLVGGRTPIVWTLHDLWPLAGGCHLPLSFQTDGAKLCSTYSLGCGVCPLLNSSEVEDWSRQLCHEKSVLASPNIHYIAVSHHTAKLFSQAYNMRLRSSLPVVIPPPIHPSYLSEVSTTEVILPFSPEPNTSYILIAAARLDDAVKGGDFLIDMANRLYQRKGERSICLLLVGTIKTQGFFSRIQLPYIELGSICSKAMMRRLYRLASVTLSTSLFETFGQTLTEAISSGCPVLSFTSGGPEDIIQEGVNGYLIPAYDTQRMAEQLIHLLDRPLERTRIQHTALRYTPEAIAEAHIQLYHQIS